MTTDIRMGTRASRLAQWQTGRIAEAIARLDPSMRCRPVNVVSRGDRERTLPIAALGETGVFTEALEQALLGGEIDLAVHSLKDLPIIERPGLRLVAIAMREDPRDVLVSRAGATLDRLPPGSRIGTSSPRRTAQLRAARSDLEPVEVRGNVDTRVRKVKDGLLAAVVLAAAGLHRLELQAEIAEYLAPEVMLPAPGQGAIAVQCRRDDPLVELLAQLDEPVVRAATTAERAFHAALGGGCTAPIGALAVIDGALHLRGLVADLDGGRRVAVELDGPVAEAETIGRRAAELALERGAGALLA